MKTVFAVVALVLAGVIGMPAAVAAERDPLPKPGCVFSGGGIICGGAQPTADPNEHLPRQDPDPAPPPPSTPAVPPSTPAVPPAQSEPPAEPTAEPTAEPSTEPTAEPSTDPSLTPTTRAPERDEPSPVGAPAQDRSSGGIGPLAIILFVGAAIAAAIATLVGRRRRERPARAQDDD